MMKFHLIFLLLSTSAFAGKIKLVPSEIMYAYPEDIRESIFEQFLRNEIVMLAEIIQVEKGGESAPFFEYGHNVSPHFILVEPKKIWKGNPPKEMELAIMPVRPMLPPAPPLPEPGKTYLFFVRKKYWPAESYWWVKDPARKKTPAAEMHTLNLYRMPEFTRCLDEVVKPGLTREALVEEFRACGLRVFPGTFKYMRHNPDWLPGEAANYARTFAVPVKEAIRITNEFAACTKGGFKEKKCEAYKFGVKITDYQREEVVRILEKGNPEREKPRYREIPKEEWLLEEYGPWILEDFPLKKGIEVRP